MMAAYEAEEGKGETAFLSRVPIFLNEEKLLTVLRREFGNDHVDEVAIVNQTKNDDGDATSFENVEDDSEKISNLSDKRSTFAFVSFSDRNVFLSAIEKGSIRWIPKEYNFDFDLKERLKKSYRMYIRPKSQSEGNGSEKGKEVRVCFLWTEKRCTHGENCKFSHEGEGACILKGTSKKKCFSFKKKGKCKLGAKCPFSHDIVNGKQSRNLEAASLPPSEKDCINWKTKGKCRKKDKCPYRHDPAVRDKVLMRRKSLNEIADDSLFGNKRKIRDKIRQPLSIRVFGLNYNTTEEDVREFFSACGKIVEITFPKFEDSGRSKGYCGILFQSPKAVEKAVGLDESELHGRWLSVQAGKMYLRQWEQNTEKQQQRSEVGALDDVNGEESYVGEYGQKVKKRKKHGYTQD